MYYMAVPSADSMSVNVSRKTNVPNNITHHQICPLHLLQQQCTLLHVAVAHLSGHLLLPLHAQVVGEKTLGLAQVVSALPAFPP